MNNIPDIDTSKYEYPPLVLDVRGGDPEFVNVIEKAIEQFTFSQLPAGQQLTFKMMKEFGWDSAGRALLQAQDDLIASGHDSFHVRLAPTFMATTLGETIFAYISEQDKLRFFPYNDVYFDYVDRCVLCRFRSLRKNGKGKKAYYYSRLNPTVEIEGKQCTVAYSKHSIQRICERIVPDWNTYTGMGKIFAYLHSCCHHEVVRLNNNHLAFTFFDRCDSPEFWPYMYTKEVLGEGQLRAGKGKPYYRIGYCPLDLFQSDSGVWFAKARTLLFPGYQQTPESKLFESCPLQSEEKARLASVAHDATALYLQNTNDFSALKWFHDNGVMQVVQSNDQIFNDKYDHVSGDTMCKVYIFLS